MKVVNLEDLSEIFLFSLKRDEAFQVVVNNLNVYLKIDIKENHDKLLIFSNGAVNRKIKVPPVYMRSSWADEIDASCVFLDDRTIHDSNLRIGWGVGTKDRHYLEDYSRIVKKISSILKVHNENLYYVGSSAGGFMSMLLACMHEGSSAIVNNPQTKVLDFNKSHVDELCDEIFPNMSREEVTENYSTRLDAAIAMKESHYIPFLYYLQNGKCQRDMEKQYNPFLRTLRRNKVSESKFRYILYNDYDRGHNPLVKDEFIDEVHKIIR